MRSFILINLFCPDKKFSFYFSNREILVFDNNINHINKSIFYVGKHIEEIKQNISILRKKLIF